MTFVVKSPEKTDEVKLHCFEISPNFHTFAIRTQEIPKFIFQINGLVYAGSSIYTGIRKSGVFLPTFYL